MLTYVLDASAYMRFLDCEPGGTRVEEILDEHTQEAARVIMSAVQWEEIVKIITHRRPALAVATVKGDLEDIEVEIVPATTDRAERSALLGLKYKIAYADAFALELASQSPSHVLVTADHGVKSAEQDIRIEFLPTKLKQ